MDGHSPYILTLAQCISTLSFKAQDFTFSTYVDWIYLYFVPLCVDCYHGFSTVTICSESVHQCDIQLDVLAHTDTQNTYTGLGKSFYCECI